MRTVGALVAAVLTLAACGSPAPAPPKDPARDLAGKVTIDDVYVHLQKLDDIAKANRNSRAEGTSGYDASVDYVAGLLRDKGFDVSTPEFERVAIDKPGRPTLTVAGRTFGVTQASPLTNTPAGGLSAPTLRPVDPAGCSAADYGSVDVKEALAVVDDTACSVVDKLGVAAARGAVGLLVVSARGPNGPRAGLFPPDYYRQLTLSVAVIGTDVDAQLRRSSAPVTLVLDATSRLVKSRNILAQTKTGAQHHVVLAGTHLDSAPNSPGINDDGTGVAAVLATALALGSAPNVTNAVRFAFWGSGEAGLAGSTKYVQALGPDGLKDVALYLNFDAIGSPNAGYFTYDGDQSGTPNPSIPAASVPAGSAGVERTLAGYLYLAGVRPADMPLAHASDYSAFLTAGIPIGGLTTGTNQRKTELQARLWGGRAGQPFDPNYRTPRDDIGNVDRHALSITAPAVAFAVGTYAQSTDGVNGVPGN